MPPLRIAPDGRCVGVLAYRGSRVHLSGRLTRGRLRGTTTISTGGCSGSIRAFSARLTS